MARRPANGYKKADVLFEQHGRIWLARPMSVSGAQFLRARDGERFDGALVMEATDVAEVSQACVNRGLVASTW